MHDDVRAAAIETQDLTASCNVPFEQLSIIRNASDEELRVAIETAAKALVPGSIEQIVCPVEPEQLLARVAIAALVLRKRRMATRLDG